MRMRCRSTSGPKPEVEALIANDGPSGRSRPLSRAYRCISSGP
jgi:hypothetical protein